MLWETFSAFNKAVNLVPINLVSDVGQPGLLSHHFRPLLGAQRAPSMELTVGARKRCVKHPIFLVNYIREGFQKKEDKKVNPRFTYWGGV